MDLVETSLTRSRVRLVNPSPRTLTTVPAGQTPPPGTTSVIDTLPPTVTVPGVIRSATTGPLNRFQIESGSSVNFVLAPMAASGRMRIETLRNG